MPKEYVQKCKPDNRTKKAIKETLAYAIKKKEN